jgi:hypothetical protein
MFRRLFLAAALLGSSAFAGPQLTTIQDVLYKADGTRFNGTLAISWSSFQATDLTSIAMQNLNVKVVAGNLRVQLVPTSGSIPPTIYSVTYNSDGKVTFHEAWSVPLTRQVIRLRDVRVSSSSTTSTGTETGSGTNTAVEESDVNGLTEDLSARPVKGTGYAPGGVAIVNLGGAIDTATGVASDCVHVDGSSGPCGSGQSALFVDADSPSGIVDGANTQFNLTYLPNPSSSLAFYRNGMLQKLGQDFTLNGQALTMLGDATPQPGDTLLAWYRLSSSGDGSLSFVDSDSLSGVEDGSNPLFTLSATPNPTSSLAVFRNGILQKAAQDYNLSGQSVIFLGAAIPQSGDTLLASYRLSGGGAGSSSQTYPVTQVICGGNGISTNSTTLTSLGTCTIPAGLLLPGDRLEIRSDVAHQGGAAGFSLEIRWGNTVVGHRDGSASDALVATRADAGLRVTGAQLSFQSWGTSLPFAAGVIDSSDIYSTGITIDFLGKLSAAGIDSVSLTNFTVVRLP